MKRCAPTSWTMPAAEAADRFGYSTASIHQMATLLRKGSLNLFTQTRPGPKGPLDPSRRRGATTAQPTPGHPPGSPGAAIAGRVLPQRAVPAPVLSGRLPR